MLAYCFGARIKPALASDHAAWEMQDALVAWLREVGHEAADLGTHGPESVDYPDYG